jgi:hypothetical protein
MLANLSVTRCSLEYIILFYIVATFDYNAEHNYTRQTCRAKETDLLTMAPSKKQSMLLFMEQALLRYICDQTA